MRIFLHVLAAIVLFTKCSPEKNSNAELQRLNASYDSLSQRIANYQPVITDTSVYGEWMDGTVMVEITPVSIRNLFSMDQEVYDYMIDGDTLKYTGYYGDTKKYFKMENGRLAVADINYGMVGTARYLQRRDTVLENMKNKLMQIAKEIAALSPKKDASTTAFICPDCDEEITDGKMYYKVSGNIQPVSLKGKSPSEYPLGVVPYPCFDCVKKY